MKKVISVAVFCFVLVWGWAAAAECNLVPNRLATAKPGEWASYALPGGYVQKLTIEKREGEGEDAEVTVRIDNMLNDKVVNSRMVTERAGAPLTEPTRLEAPGVTMTLRHECLECEGGETITVSIVRIAKFVAEGDEDNTVTEWWLSSSVPVFGILKKVTDGETEWELVDSGLLQPSPSGK